MKKLANHTFLFVKILTNRLTRYIEKDKIRKDYVKVNQTHNLGSFIQGGEHYGLHVNRTTTNDEEVIR